jgi:hypothetical protein
VVVTLAIAIGVANLLIDAGDIIEFRTLDTGELSIGMVMVCNPQMLFYIKVYNIKQEKTNWITLQQIIRKV